MDKDKRGSRLFGTRILSIFSTDHERKEHRSQPRTTLAFTPANALNTTRSLDVRLVSSTASQLPPRPTLDPARQAGGRSPLSRAPLANAGRLRGSLAALSRTDLPTPKNVVRLLLALASPENSDRPSRSDVVTLSSYESRADPVELHPVTPGTRMRRKPPSEPVADLEPTLRLDDIIGTIELELRLMLPNTHEGSPGWARLVVSDSLVYDTGTEGTDESPGYGERRAEADSIRAAPTDPSHFTQHSPYSQTTPSGQGFAQGDPQGEKHLYHSSSERAQFAPEAQPSLAARSTRDPYSPKEHSPSTSFVPNAQYESQNTARPEAQNRKGSQPFAPGVPNSAYPDVYDPSDYIEAGKYAMENNQNYFLHNTLSNTYTTSMKSDTKTASAPTRRGPPESVLPEGPISGGLINASTPSVDMARELAGTSGTSVNSSGQSVALSGRSTELSGQSADLSGQSAELSGQSAELSGHSAELNGLSVDLSAHSVNLARAGLDGIGKHATTRTSRASRISLELSGADADPSGMSAVGGEFSFPSLFDDGHVRSQPLRRAPDALHKRILSVSSINSGLSMGHVSLATLKRSFTFRPGEGERSAYVHALRRGAGTAYNDAGPGKWKLPTGIMPVDGKTMAINGRFNRLGAGILPRMKKATGVELKHGHLQPRLLAAEVDEVDETNRFGSLGRSNTHNNRTARVPVAMHKSSTSIHSRITPTTSVSSTPPVYASSDFVAGLGSPMASTSTDTQSVRTKASTMSSVSSEGSLADQIGDGFYQHPLYKDSEDQTDTYSQFEEGVASEDDDSDKPQLFLANPDTSSDEE